MSAIDPPHGPRQARGEASTNGAAPGRSSASGRLLSLVRKEMRQMLRDRSNLAIGILLPAVLILIFGYGISLDLPKARVAVVLQADSPEAREAIAGLQLSRYVAPVHAHTLQQAERWMREGEVDGVLRLPETFARDLAAGHPAAQLLVHGSDPSVALAVQSYVAGALASAGARRQDRATDAVAMPVPGAVVEPRLWFNAANTSTWYLVPGLIVLTLTIVGAFLTSLVMAREWERGTLEALYVTPVRPAEILAAKLAPYLLVGLAGFAMCVAAARLLFQVPLVGSPFTLALAGLLYLAVALAQGLLISSATKNQFLASQLALLTSFLPALMLSGFLFDLNNVPTVVRWLGEVLPATHALRLLRTLFLAGDVPSLVWRESLIVLAYAVVLLGAARAVTRKRLA